MHFYFPFWGCGSGSCYNEILHFKIYHYITKTQNYFSVYAREISCRLITGCLDCWWTVTFTAKTNWVGMRMEQKLNSYKYI